MLDNVTKIGTLPLAMNERTPEAQVPTPKNQAQRVFRKFGGVPALYKALGRLGADHRRAISVIYRWDMSRAKGGTNGIIPSSAMASILKAARAEGLVLTAEDMDPRPSA